MDNPSFCNKCGFVGKAQVGGYHFRPRDGEPCNYAAPPAKPSTPSNEELTQRMDKAGSEAIALLLDMDAFFGKHGVDEKVVALFRRASDIVSDLPKPVDSIDPDEAFARELLAERGWKNTPDDSDMLPAEAVVKLLAQAHRIGRTLAAGGTAHE